MGEVVGAVIGIIILLAVLSAYHIAIPVWVLSIIVPVILILVLASLLGIKLGGGGGIGHIFGAIFGGIASLLRGIWNWPPGRLVAHHLILLALAIWVWWPYAVWDWFRVWHHGPSDHIGAEIVFCWGLLTAGAAYESIRHYQSMEIDPPPWVTYSVLALAGLPMILAAGLAWIL